ncbi:hypothetical protein LC612_29280 [Nostoc sp. CHAB 5834]|nr:hypothetical protein [Nostoc sp. CHAB 5834]
MSLKDPGQLSFLFEELLRLNYFETIKVSEEWWPDDAQGDETRLMLTAPELKAAVRATVTEVPFRAFLALPLPLTTDAGKVTSLEVYDEQGRLVFRRALFELNDLLLSAIHSELFRGLISMNPHNAWL